MYSSVTRCRSLTGGTLGTLLLLLPVETPLDGPQVYYGFINTAGCYAVLQQSIRARLGNEGNEGKWGGTVIAH